MSFLVFLKQLVKYKRSMILILIVILFYCGFGYIQDFSKSSIAFDQTASITRFPDVHLPHKTVKKIVLWTPFFRKPHDMAAHRNCLTGCDFRCDVTDDKQEVDDADAIEFHLSDVWSKFWRIGTKSVIEFPKRRNVHQVRILYNLEPPIHMWGDLKIMNGLFNWTKWYRLDSDIPVPYGMRREMTPEEKAKAASELKDRNFFREKTKDMYLRISNCYDVGQRYKLTDELDKHLNIDKFGLCYTNKRCDDSTCSETILKQYKFHLAFENDYCKYYVTEKYWESLRRDQIPIVNWKHGAFESAIPGSFINLFDFKDLSTAIQYIKDVNDNETLYNSYFNYRLHYKDQVETCSMCAVCRALHDTTRTGQVYTDLESWVRDDTCQKIGYWNEITRNVKGFMYYKFGLR